MPTNRTICATPQEVEALLNGRLTTFWRPVKPLKMDRGVLRWRPHGRDINVDHINASMCPYGQPGDVLAVKETWADEADVGPGVSPAPYLRYRASRNTATKWRSSATMPRWAVRPGFTRPIAEVRVVKVQEISATDVEAAGVDVAGKLPAIVAPGTDMERLDALVEVVARKQFERDWDARYANTPYAWSDNPPAWAVTIGGSDHGALLERSN